MKSPWKVSSNYINGEKVAEELNQKEEIKCMD